MFKKFSPLFQLSLCAASCLWTNAAQGQVVSDGTVGTQITQNGGVAEITGGETRGTNLFHSFQEFSVPNSTEAFFNNSPNINDIFSRVTGGRISDIDGTIRVKGTANLFLINPAGILFGENARLNLGGSFYGSTASSILFEDGEFSAIDEVQQPALTINAPIGLGFRDTSGDIVNKANSFGLEVTTGRNIALVGGNVRFDGGRVIAPGGNITLGGLASPGQVSFADENSLAFPNDVNKSNLSLANKSEVNISSAGGGLIFLDTNNLEITGESLVLANINENLGSLEAVAGTIEIKANNFTGRQKSFIQSDNLGTGNAGTININVNTLDLAEEAAITASTFGPGDAGDINLTAQDINIADEFSGIYSSVGLTTFAPESLELDISGVSGNGGEISVNTNNLELTNGARILSNSIAQGGAGSININATGDVSFIGQGTTPIEAFNGGPVISGSFSQVQQAGTGNSGSVSIDASSLTLIDKGAVLANNSGAEGNAGDINLNIQGDIFLDQEGLILAKVNPGAAGNGGNINISANSFTAQGGSFILADTAGTGDAGNINIELAESLTLAEGTRVLTEVQEEGIGNAGDITITTGSLNLEGNSSIASQTFGQGNGGNISLVVEEKTALNNSEIKSLVDDTALGNGGDIFISGGELNLNDDSRIVADIAGKSLESGEISTAGNIEIDITGDINLDNSNQIQSQTRGDAVGDAGNINIKADGSLISTNGNLILADSQAKGNGGSIKIEVGEKILLEGFSEGGFPSQIVAGLTRDNSQGTGGTIEISSGELVLKDVAFISSNTVENSIGSAGSIQLDVDNVSLTQNSFINVFTGNDFDAGSIKIDAKQIELATGGKILAATAGSGNAGNVELTTNQDIKINNGLGSTASFIDFGSNQQLLNDLQQAPSGVYANATGVGTGNGGNIFLQARSLQMNNNAIVSASTFSGEGGEVDITLSEDLTLENNSAISAQAFGLAQGGNLEIDARFVLAFPSNGTGSDLVAAAGEGAGGNITLNVEQLFGLASGKAIDQGDGSFVANNTNDIDVSGNLEDGDLQINTTRLNPFQGATELPSNIVAPQETAQQVCEANRGSSSQSNFTVKGKGGIPPTPNMPLSSQTMYSNGESFVTQDLPAAIKTSIGKIQPARGLVKDELGRLKLTAYRTDSRGERTPHASSSCGKA